MSDPTSLLKQFCEARTDEERRSAETKYNEWVAVHRGYKGRVKITGRNKIHKVGYVLASRGEMFLTEGYAVEATHVSVVED